MPRCVVWYREFGIRDGVKGCVPAPQMSGVPEQGAPDRRPCGLYNYSCTKVVLEGVTHRLRAIGGDPRRKGPRAVRVMLMGSLARDVTTG